jgi:hypothetical protein
MKSTVLATCGLVVFLGCANDAPEVELSEETSKLDDDDSGPFAQGADGLVSIEAEHPHHHIDRSDKGWDDATSPGSSGTAIVVGPNSGALFELADLWFAPRIDFAVKFERVGLHYLWIRGRAANGSDDSAHAGIDRFPLAPRISGFGTDWTWSGETMGGFRAVIWVWYAGTHRINVWMREDGLEIDKLVVTKDAAYQPAGQGPNESPQHDHCDDGIGGDSDAPPCDDAVCGNGIVEDGESCDGGACCTVACSFASAASVCRGSAGACDVAEACTGSTADCPADTFAAAGTECRGSAGACDVAEACAGDSPSCPIDTFVTAGTECRGSTGDCDVPEACTGASGACPDDGFVAAGTECRGSAGACDAVEACTGGDAACPADVLAAAGTVCRGSTGACDIAEVCDGGTLACPSDGFANEPPVVSAGPDVEVPVTTGTATLAGTATDDGCPSTDALVVSWSAISGPGSVAFADPGSASTTATFSAGGVYELQLSAYDEIQTVTDRVIVTVNIGPSADAGPDRIINAPTMQVTLFGSVSDDGIPAAGTLQATWSVVSGPAGATFAPPDAQVTTVTFTETGDYVLRLTADDAAMTASDDVVVRVAPPPDLVVDSVVAPAVDGNTLTVSGTASAAVTNQGGTTEQGFAVTFFEDRDGNGTLDPAVDGVLGVGTHTGIATGETVSVEAAVSGTVEFAFNVTYAFADSGEELAESDETNNYGSSSPPCEAHGPSAPFTPDLEWSWTVGTTAPASNEVQTTPMIADMNGDGVSDIVFTSHPAFSQLNGSLRAIDGRTGAELFTTNGANALSGIAQLAVGDIDLDGLPEVIGVSSNTLALIAFEHDGTFKWRHTLASPAVPMVWGGAAIADLDGDGVPEIIAGKTVINADGSLRWTGAAGSGSYLDGPLTTVADLDLDGQSEVIAGRTAYRADGSIMWDLAALPDGLAAVANFDADANPEVVLAASGRIWVLEHTGEIKWTESTSIVGVNGGAVVIADFDGDGAVEIGRSGSSLYGVWETDGTLKWTQAIQDPNSGVTSSSAFDFENDGAAEVVFADEWGVRVFDGATGATKFEQRLGSCTGYENPVVADIDADGRAELVAVANTSCGIAGNVNHGVFVFGNDAWIGSRAIWNQHTYHVTNVNDDATIPAHADPAASFRRNVASACPYLLPDLTASFLRVTSVGAAYDLTVRIGNGGANPTPDGVPVTFYDGDPSAGGVPLGTASTSVYLAPGEFEDVTLTVPATPTTGTIWIAADDASDMIGTIFESDEGNNLFDSGVGL